MVKITYEVVKHDGGWAYRVDGAYSSPFPSHSDALQAATIAATAQQRRDQSDALAMDVEQGNMQDRLNLEVMDNSRSRHRFSLSAKA